MLFRVTPEIISVLDYRKGFGHSDLVKIAGLEEIRHRGALHSISMSEQQNTQSRDPDVRAEAAAARAAWRSPGRH